MNEELKEIMEKQTRDFISWFTTANSEEQSKAIKDFEDTYKWNFALYAMLLPTITICKEIMNG